MERLLDRAVSRGMQRGMNGEPEWLAVALAAWMVRRSVQRGRGVIWRGTLTAGEQLTLVALRRWSTRDGMTA